MIENSHRWRGSLRRWERWIEHWLVPESLDRLDAVGDEVGWTVRFQDGTRGEIRIKSAALHGDRQTFERIVERLDSKHWIEVIRERSAIRIHENAWIEKVH